MQRPAKEMLRRSVPQRSLWSRSSMRTRTWRRLQDNMCYRTPCQSPTGTRATWTLTCSWKAKGHSLKRSLGTRPFLPPGQVICQVFDPTGVLYFLIVSSFSCIPVSLVLFYKTVRLSMLDLPGWLNWFPLYWGSSVTTVRLYEVGKNIMLILNVCFEI
jgi:hypothetical protein